jgi:hypothetical protein
LILHPFLFAIYPVLALLAHNIEAVPANAAFRSLLTSFAVAVLLLLISWLLVKNIRKSALITTLTLILFYSYGRLYAALDGFNLLGIPLGRHRILLPLFIALWAVVVFWILRQKGDLRVVTRTINLVGLILIIFPLLSIGSFVINSNAANLPTLGQSTPGLAKASSPPDIYYIILDGYTREDVLKRSFDYDNTAFLQELAGLGFRVASCSQSNYATTELSLASSLNMDYLQDLDKAYTDPANRSMAALPRWIRSGTVRQFLQQQGYKTVAFESGWGWTDMTDADTYLTPETRPSKIKEVLGGANEFEVMLLKTSGGLLVADTTVKLPKFLKPDLTSPQKTEREHIEYILDELPTVPLLPGPKFVFAHIVLPHTPPHFGANGEVIEGNVDPVKAYRDQVIYTNKRILPILRQIIADSHAPPVIIVQGDHGWPDFTPVDRMPILNAFYLPQGGDQKLYDGISPVNTFRLIFDYYFGAGYAFLPDTSYYSRYSLPYSYTLIEDKSPGCKK